jgi:hypothetical protein
MAGYFEASTGTAAALVAAAQRPYYMKAIVSRNDYKKDIDWDKDALNELGTKKKKLVIISMLPTFLKNQELWRKFLD